MKRQNTNNETDINLYLSVSEGIAKSITHRYSTSFSLGIYGLAAEHRAHIRNLYAYVRVADEIVDTFHEHDKRSLLERFRRDTDQALDEKISYNPVLHAFQYTVHRYAIPRHLIDAFLDSMEMDLDYRSYEDESFSQYIYGSAEVVGLMCLKVFCNGDETLFKSLIEPARSLGAAFQKVNFLRDLKSDFRERGRVYFPQVDFFQNFDLSVKRHIEEDIDRDFAKAYEGIKQLPKESRFGVYIAFVYYKALLNKIHRLEPKRIIEERVRVSNPEKIMLFLTSWVMFKFRGV